MATEKRLIDANALKSEYEWLLSVVNNCSKPEIFDAIERIEKAPTVDAVEVVHGRWLYDGGDMTYFCSKCGDGAIRHRTTFLDTSTLVEDCLSNYCPNCGAKMDGDGNA